VSKEEVRLGQDCFEGLPVVGFPGLREVFRFAFRKADVA
jgi:hypothetical protein